MDKAYLEYGLSITKQKTGICSHPKDIQRITGRSERYCRKVLQQIRETLGKHSHQYVSLEEFANYSGLDLPTVRSYITD